MQRESRSEGIRGGGGLACASPSPDLPSHSPLPPSPTRPAPPLPHPPPPYRPSHPPALSPSALPPAALAPHRPSHSVPAHARPRPACPAPPLPCRIPHSHPPATARTTPVTAPLLAPSLPRTPLPPARTFPVLLAVLILAVVHVAVGVFIDACVRPPPPAWRARGAGPRWARCARVAVTLARRVAQTRPREASGAEARARVRSTTALAQHPRPARVLPSACRPAPPRPPRSTTTGLKRAHAGGPGPQRRLDWARARPAPLRPVQRQRRGGARHGHANWPGPDQRTERERERGMRDTVGVEGAGAGRGKWRRRERSMC